MLTRLVSELKETQVPQPPKLGLKPCATALSLFLFPVTCTTRDRQRISFCSLQLLTVPGRSFPPSLPLLTLATPGIWQISQQEPLPVASPPPLGGPAVLFLILFMCMALLPPCIVCGTCVPDALRGQKRESSPGTGVTNVPNLHCFNRVHKWAGLQKWLKVLTTTSREKALLHGNVASRDYTWVGGVLGVLGMFGYFTADFKG